jgi:mannose-1-phosphate guanylyltransferase
MIYPVIMAGGSGTRLWPLSRQLNPKQFLALVDEELTMLQSTVKRLEGLDVVSPLLICNEEHRFLAAEQLRQLYDEQPTLLLEPAGRNTAPAIALAALEARAEGEDPVLLVLAADHAMDDAEAFQASVRKALPLAEAGSLVTFGITPTHAETGYGYIEQGEGTGDGYVVRQFVEKPDADTAQSYYDSGRFSWNSGMFMFRASRYLEALKQFRPDILEACEKAWAGRAADMDFVRLDQAAFEACPAESVDYAVMEPLSRASDDAVMVPLDAGWSDIGSWAALWQASEQDARANVLKGDVIAEESRRSFVQAEHRLVATLGVENLVIVETKDAVLVADKDRVQDVKKVVERIRGDARHEHMNHREVYRPWGVYDSVDHGHRYQVKRITVKPGQQLSTQMHHHRAEHWVVVSGTAEVFNGEENYIVSENESTFIPIGQVHSLRNPGVIPLELIEVQSGSYLGEDDIVRFEDQYGRTRE